jgi:hypothetical protein
MISDVLFEAEQEIERYLADGWSGKPGEPVREQIKILLQHMRTVRLMPGLDSPPVDKELD